MLEEEKNKFLVTYGEEMGNAALKIINFSNIVERTNIKIRLNARTKLIKILNNFLFSENREETLNNMQLFTATRELIFQNSYKKQYFSSLQTGMEKLIESNSLEPDKVTQCIKDIQDYLRTESKAILEANETKSDLGKINSFK